MEQEEFRHNIRALLKPKSKEEFLNDVRGQYITNEIEVTYKQHYKEEFPLHLLQLEQQINRILKKEYPKYYQGQGTLVVRRTRMYFSGTKLRILKDVTYQNAKEKAKIFEDVSNIVILNMSPTRRIDGLEHVRNGTRFVLTNRDQIRTIIKFLETH